jgi:phosphate:Na+ symporter
MRAQYNKARRFLAEALRAIQQVSQDKETSRKALEEIKARIETYDIVGSGEIDSLIRERRITPEMATSLINDSGYVMNIGRKLAQAGLLVLRDQTYDLLMSLRAESEEQGAGGAEAESGLSGIEARAESTIS